MNNYRYTAVNISGEFVKGVAKGVDADDAVLSLSRKGLYVLNVKGANRYVKMMDDKLAVWRITRRDVIEFSSNLAVMLRGGVPLLSAMEDIILTTAHESMKAVVIDVMSHVEMGIYFSAALEMHNDIFPDIMIKLVKVGEETGRLDQSLAEAATHLQKVEDLSSTVRRALIYPFFSLMTTGAAVVLWFAYVLPNIMNVLVTLKVEMPSLTRWLYNISLISGRYWYMAFVIPVLILIILRLMRLTPLTRRYLDLMKIKLPLIRILYCNKLLALFAEQLRLMISTGITIDRSFDIAADVIDNEVFKRAILDAKRDIMSGVKISEAMAMQKIFPHLFIRMVSIGEFSGNLDHQFGFLGEFYYKIVDDFSDKIGKVIEPILMIVLGSIMAIIVIGVMLPMYDIFTKMVS